ncbi:MAG TPA: hypothetical protein PK364_09590 [Synergistaceae bacterium]|nr:hypothetical protein [Synergistaceae bacterium]HPJ25278.1 hypothetical protein [Synergistaceae bacterium]HPQ38118.1 hypothetical protein [Synergistaceae bacterium]
MATMCAGIGNAVMQCLSEKAEITSPMVVAGGFIRGRCETRQSVDEAYLRAGTALLKRGNYSELSARK